MCAAFIREQSSSPTKAGKMDNPEYKFRRAARNTIDGTLKVGETVEIMLMHAEEMHRALENKPQVHHDLLVALDREIIAKALWEANKPYSDSCSWDYGKAATHMVEESKEHWRVLADAAIDAAQGG